MLSCKLTFLPLWWAVMTRCPAQGTALRLGRWWASVMEGFDRPSLVEFVDAADVADGSGVDDVADVADVAAAVVAKADEAVLTCKWRRPHNLAGC